MSKATINTHNLNLKSSYLNLPSAFYTKINPEPTISPKLVIFNEALSESMGLPLSSMTTEEKANFFSGNEIPADVTPFSQAYAGHQFGHFTILGDGRAHILGEHLMPNGTIVDIQLKGSGRTPYSRRGDGRAALGPMLREYIISEAMHALGIPTTRSLAVVTTGEDIIRETQLPGAILTRIASSHIRVGTFEYAATKSDSSIVKKLLDYTVSRHFPMMSDSNQKALDFLEKTMSHQIELIINWMRVGFIHGVMNTDNMAISGETIDYGPCAFMDSYDPGTVFSSIDQMGRYAFSNQPMIAQWNLTRLAETLLPVFDRRMETAIEIATKSLERFTKLYHTKWLDMMKQKLGLFHSDTNDQTLILDLLNWMTINEADYTNTFIDLSQAKKPSQKIYQTSQFNNWYKRWQNRIKKNNKALQESINLMQSNNPVFIPRNHLVEDALDAANNNNLEPFKTLLTVLKTPYKDNPKFNEYKKPAKPSDTPYQTFCGT
ncbi:MAG: YdiU family protein [Candidatus Margulisiibacteriota bacterium]|nr:YdiU family protein [Candidatus Margulisiibacteriota bacterium]